MIKSGQDVWFPVQSERRDKRRRGKEIEMEGRVLTRR
jgi:hypothetical protein